MESPIPPKATHTYRIQHSRREFLTKTALLTGGILAFGLPLPIRQSQSVQAAPRPESTGIRYALDLDGQIAGPITSLESGFISGQVVEQNLGQTPYPQKHLATIVHEDIAIQCGHTMAPGLYHWIQQALEGQGTQRAGAILTTNSTNQIIDRKLFSSALLTEVTFPALDRSANTPASLGLTIKPAQLSYQPGPGGQIALPGAHQFRPWLRSKFRLSIDGLEQACVHVVRVEPLMWKQLTNQGQIGDRRSRTSTIGQIQTPNLIVTLPQAQVGPFTEWFHQFVIQGHTSDSDERSGMLEFLEPDLQTPLFELSFGHLGIFRMSPVPQSQTNPVPMVKVEMYCETMQLSRFPGTGSSSGASQPAPTTQQNAPSTQQKVAPPQPKSRMQPRTKTLTPRLPQTR